MLAANARWWRSAVAISVAVERRWVSQWRRRFQRSALAESSETALALSGRITSACSSSAMARAQASAAGRAWSPMFAAARAWARLVSTASREMEVIRARRVGSKSSQTWWRRPKWAGGPRGSSIKALGGTGESGRRPRVRSVPEPEIALSVDGATGEGGVARSVDGAIGEEVP